MDKTNISFSLRHVGINAQNTTEASKIAGLFSETFNMPYKEGNSSIFAGSIIEVMKKPYLGEHGHIALETPSLPDAIAYLESVGQKVDMDTAKYDSTGEMVAVYLEGDFGGFAVHLIRP